LKIANCSWTFLWWEIIYQSLGTLLIVKSRIQSVPDVVRLSEKFLFLKKEKKRGTLNLRKINEYEKKHRE
jgi:hypothetical protein